jgi:glycosyltransferase involved in cell wall biosynthesis
MRVLFISAFYPPHVIGGWEQLVEDINTRLRDRGHITQVLTSEYTTGAAGRAEDDGVERVLSLESDIIHYRPSSYFLTRPRRVRENLKSVRNAIVRFKPDVVFIHSMWNLTRGIAWMAEQLCPGRVVYYLANDWPYVPDVHADYWRDPATRAARRLFKRLVAPVVLNRVEREQRAYALRFERVLCVSNAIRDNLIRHAGIAREQTAVVYNGIELDRFLSSKPIDGDDSKQGISLLYAGSLVPHKGVHTAIEAMALLNGTALERDVSLTIVGSGHPDYEADLKALVTRENLAEWVHFRGRVERDRMPSLLAEFDALIFPSIWEEPLARMVQEAMAAGLVVIGTTTGGSAEILIEGETGLTFPAGDASSLARQIERFAENAQLRSSLRQQGREKVVRCFDLNRMIDEIEVHLQSVVVGTSNPELVGK